LNPAGSFLVYSTYLGGNVADSGAAIAVDSGGNAYLTGWTSSTNFPTTKGAYQPTFSGVPTPNTLGSPTDAFVTKLSADGSTLVYSTYLGGYSLGESIAVDQEGNAYVFGGFSGYASTPVPFPTTPGVFTPACSDLPSGVGGFVAKLNMSGTALDYSTTLNCANVSMVQPVGGIVVDASDNVYVAGSTNSRDLPVSLGAYQTDNLRGTSKPFIIKLNPTATGLLYGTYVGGTGGDEVSSVAVDSAGRAFITGQTGSADFPVTPDAFQQKLPGTFGAFVTVLNAAGTGLVFSTYLGGEYGTGSASYSNGSTSGTSVAVDSGGNAYITGQTNAIDFPTINAFQPTTLTGLSNAFVAKIGMTTGLSFAGSMAQLASGGGWDTTLTLVNTGAATGEAQLNFFANDGSPLQLPFTFPQMLSPAGPQVASTLDEPLNVNSLLVIDTQQRGNPDTQVGSVQLLTGGNIGGFAIFQYTPTGQEAVVPLETRNAPAYVLAFDNTGVLGTGVAIGNVAMQPASIPVIIRDDTGAQLGTGSISLPSQGHIHADEQLRHHRGQTRHHRVRYATFRPDQRAWPAR
jgi:hypothetical protein